MRTVRAVRGHAQIGLAMNLASHVMPAAMRDAADRMRPSSCPPLRAFWW
jgi:hypothetical protein